MSRFRRVRDHIDKATDLLISKCFLRRDKFVVRSAGYLVHWGPMHDDATLTTVTLDESIVVVIEVASRDVKEIMIHLTPFTTECERVSEDEKFSRIRLEFTMSESAVVMR